MATDRQRFILINDRVRHNALTALMKAPAGYAVSVAPASRSLDQNAKFHAICLDIAKSGFPWAGKRRSQDEWKVLLISGHAVATKHQGEVIPGIEGEFVAIRESSASMNVARAASLITYALAFCDAHGIPLTETMRGGYLNEAEAA